MTNQKLPILHLLPKKVKQKDKFLKCLIHRLHLRRKSNPTWRWWWVFHLWDTPLCTAPDTSSVYLFMTDNPTNEERKPSDNNRYRKGFPPFIAGNIFFIFYILHTFIFLLWKSPFRYPPPLALSVNVAECTAFVVL